MFAENKCDIMWKTIKFIIGLSLLASCQPRSHNYSEQLGQLDNLIEEKPQYVLDSLEKIDPSQLHKPEKAYYYLLLASVNDKNLIPSNDSTLLISEKYYKTSDNFYNLARTQYYLAKYIYKQQDKENAYDLLKQADTNLQKVTHPDIHLQGLIYYQLARIQNNQNNLAETEFYSKKALEKFLKIQDTVSAVHCLKLLGQITIDRKDYDQSKKYLTQGLNLLDSLKDQNDRKICESRAGILSSLSILYRKTSDLSKSLEYSRECLKLFSSDEDKILSEHYYSILLVFNKLNETDSTKYYGQKLIETAKKEKRLFNIINGYRLLAKIEKQQGNYKDACFYQDKVNIYKDSLNIDANKNKVIELDKKYDIAQKEKQVLQAENNQLRSYLFFLVIVIIISFIIITIYRKHKKLKLEYTKLSEDVQHTEWGLSVTQELITINNIAYNELERLINRYSVGNTDSVIYNRFKDVLAKQKSNYSTQLIMTLTNFDKAFVKKFQSKFTNFSSADMMLAAMIRHRWKGADIAAVFHVSAEAIRKRKARLTKKITEIINEDIDLEEYLNKL